MTDNKDKKFWLLVLKLVIGAVALIAFFGLGLYFTAKFNSYAPPDTPAATDWGIAKDSPINYRR